VTDTRPTIKLANYGGGQYFGTRYLAADVRNDAEALLADHPGEQIVLDFTGAEAVTTAFADELVANLRAVYGDRITLVDANADILDAITVALDRRAGQ
jgi:STAS-like domain of unknown function (DUF4325)